MIFIFITCITSRSFPSHLTSTLTLPCYSVTSLWDSTVAATVFLTVVTIATTGTGCKYFHKRKNYRYIMILKNLLHFRYSYLFGDYTKRILGLIHWKIISLYLHKHSITDLCHICNHRFLCHIHWDNFHSRDHTVHHGDSLNKLLHILNHMYCLCIL